MGYFNKYIIRQMCNCWSQLEDSEVLTEQSEVSKVKTRSLFASSALTGNSWCWHYRLVPLSSICFWSLADSSSCQICATWREGSRFRHLGLPVLKCILYPSLLSFSHSELQSRWGRISLDLIQRDSNSSRKETKQCPPTPRSRIQRKRQRGGGDGIQMMSLVVH